jgi:16S rRNA (guanine(966)-N(2))-methyltransferase RsmD
MRVITGTAKGVNLTALSGVETRPTADKVKEAMFSAVQFALEGAVVLDLFAGSGQLGIEALSRGAGKAYFADNNPQAVAIIKGNLEKAQFFNSQCSRVDRKPYTAFLRLVKDKFDIAFLDPPYERGIIEKVLPLLVPKMNGANPDAKIICEHEKRLCLPEKVDAFEIEKVYHYGSVSLTIYRRSNK